MLLSPLPPKTREIQVFDFIVWSDNAKNSKKQNNCFPCLNYTNFNLHLSMRKKCSTLFAYAARFSAMKASVVGDTTLVSCVFTAENCGNPLDGSF
jgi:hypothetical protein